MAKESFYQPIIGLEIHIELKTESKMFCACPNNHFGAKPNIYICPVCLGLPGALPCPNQKAIDGTILIALAFGCKVNNEFSFDRKHYFYPDLPKGYQISQHFKPIAINGKMPFLVGSEKVIVGIDNIHLEEDTGKLIHQKIDNKDMTLCDFNRSGVPLVEIVTKPEIKSALEAKLCLKRIQQVIRYLGVSDCDMEKGTMRLEANISVKKLKNSKTKKLKETELPNYKVEIKNLNSFRFVEKAINYEIERQIKIFEKGETPLQETRGFDSKKGITYSQRKKEVAKDYRYFPEPDIPPFKVSAKEIEKIRKSIPKMPWGIEEEMISLGIRPENARILTAKGTTAESNWKAICLGKDNGISPIDFSNYLVNHPALGAASPREKLKAVQDSRNKAYLSEEDTAKIVNEVIKENPRATEDFKKGKTAAIGFLIGQLQRKTQGKADPRLAAKLIIKLISKDR